MKTLKLILTNSCTLQNKSTRKQSKDWNPRVYQKQDIPYTIQKCRILKLLQNIHPSHSIWGKKSGIDMPIQIQPLQGTGLFPSTIFP